MLKLSPDDLSVDHVPPDQLPPSSLLTSLDHCLPVDSKVNSISASECIFKLAQSQLQILTVTAHMTSFKLS